MSGQLAFDLDQPPARARRNDPETSRDAAKRALGFSGAHENVIGAVIEKAGARGATSKEIAAALATASTPLTHVQVDRRLGAMGERGLIRRELRAEPRSGTDYERRNGCAVWRKT